MAKTAIRLLKTTRKAKGVETPEGHMQITCILAKSHFKAVAKLAAQKKISFSAALRECIEKAA